MNAPLALAARELPVRPTRQLPAGTHAAPPEHASIQPEPSAPAETPEQAHARGLIEGEARAFARLQQQTDASDAQARREAAALATREKSLATAAHALDTLLKTHSSATEETLVRLTLLACGQVLQRLAVDEALVAHAVRAVMAEHGHEAGAALLLNPADHASLPADIFAGMALAVQPADDIAPGEFRVRTSHRQLDLAIARQYHNLCGALRRDAVHDH